MISKEALWNWAGLHRLPAESGRRRGVRPILGIPASMRQPHDSKIVWLWLRESLNFSAYHQRACVEYGDGGILHPAPNEMEDPV
jgi:hypothetical protein